MTTPTSGRWGERVGEMRLTRKSGVHKACVCFCHFPHDTHLYTVRHLHPEEATHLASLAYQARRKSYLLGRYAAKRALGSLVAEPDLRQILVRNGIFEQPIVRYAQQPNLCVSISHCGDYGAALAFTEDHPLGIDLERVNEAHNSTIEGQLTEAEKRLTNELPCSVSVGLTLLWTAKEALSKILKTGLTTPMSVFEINKIDWNGNFSVSTFSNFSQYKAVSFQVEGLMSSVALPRLSTWDMDFPWNLLEGYIVACE